MGERDVLDGWCVDLELGIGEYPVVRDRLVFVDGVAHVRCPTHGLIALDHRCGDTAHDHWCRQAAHPTFDPADGEAGLDDQGWSHDDERRAMWFQLHAGRRLHVDEGGHCRECGHRWPCATSDALSLTVMR